MIGLELPRNRRRHAMRQPDVPQQGIVALLVEIQHAAAPQTRIDLAVLVQVRRVRPGAVAAMKVEDRAFADVDEEADVPVASAVFKYQYRHRPRTIRLKKEKSHAKKTHFAMC